MTPLGTVRLLYEAWNSGSVARAAPLLAPDVRWDNYGEAKQVEGLEGLHVTLAGGSSGATMMLSPVTVDLMVGTGAHVIACTRRTQGGSEQQRFEVWTVRDGLVVRYRGYPLEEGLAVISATTDSRRIETLCRDLAAFNRGDGPRWPATVAGSGPGARLDDVEILSDSPGMLVVDAVRRPGDPAALHLAIAFDADAVRRVSGFPTAQDALAAAAAPAR